MKEWGDFSMVAQLVNRNFSADFTILLAMKEVTDPPNISPHLQKILSHECMGK